MIQTLYRYLFWLGYSAVLITSFVSVPGSLNKIKFGPEGFQIRIDHLLHFIVYFMMCLYYILGQKKGLSLIAVNQLARFIILVLFLATITELVQLWVPYRAFNVFDMIANWLGIGTGVGIIMLTKTSTPKSY